MFLSSVAEGLGIAMFLPALQLAGIDFVNQGRPGRYIDAVLRLIRHTGIHVPLAAALGAIALVLILRTAFLRLQFVFVHDTVYRFVTRVDLRIYEAVVRAQWSEMTRQRMSRFVHLLTQEHERLVVATYDFFICIGGLFSTLLYLVFACLLSLKLTLLFAVAGAALAFLLRKRTSLIHEASSQASVEMTNLTGQALEHFQNLKAVKIYDAQDRDTAMFSKTIAGASGLYLLTQRREAIANFWFDAGSLLIGIGILYLTLQFHAGAAANVFLLLAVFARMMPKLSDLYALSQTVAANVSAHSRMESAIAELGEISEHRPAHAPRLPLRDAIHFDNVSFRYPGGDRNVLQSISLSIPAGKITAIVGSSGSGKSTLADLAMGLLTPTNGHVFVDASELTPNIIHSWRSNIGYVAQETVLFHDTIRANLMWANSAATDDEIRDSLSSSAAGFVFQLPHGLGTVLGERGSTLSHGERQRIALARALVCKRSILVLDEATNNLDSENEQRVMESVNGLRGAMTILMIAHRLAAVRNADLIYVLEEGRIVEAGSWDELMGRAGGRFRTLYAISNEAF